MKILITGASGLVGSALINFLQLTPHQVYTLVRANKQNLTSHQIAWDPEAQTLEPSLLEGFDAVIHLAGESIMGRWTEKKKQRILESRVQGTHLLCKTLSQLKNPPEVLISASAIGYYGNCGNEWITEMNLKGNNSFLATVCEKWEEAAQPAVKKGIRTVYLRTGTVLSTQGGALKQMLPAFKWCLGGKIGSGTQYMSWIAISDLVRLIDYILHHEQIKGPINAVAPHPVTQLEFTRLLGQVLNRPTLCTIPACVIHLLFGQLGEEVLLSSMKAKSQILESSTFAFRYPHLQEAFMHLVKKLR
jgi:uncharacterized protein (TIGR01777 family)